MIPLGCINIMDDYFATYLSQNTLSGEWMVGAGQARKRGAVCRDTWTKTQQGADPNVRG
jgi:hypothetical protein